MDRSDKLRNIKVGIATIIAAVLLMFSYWFVGSLRLSSKTYSLSVIFSNVSGIEQGTPVMMAGVKIGRVERISLTPANLAQLDLRINQNVGIPNGSAVRMSSVSLLGDKYIEILPGPAGKGFISSDKTLIGQPTYTLDDLLPQVSAVLQRIDEIGGSIEGWLKDRRIREGIYASVDNLSRATQAAALLVEDLRRIETDNKGRVAEVASNLALATAKMASAATRVDQILQGGNRKDIQEMMTHLKSATKSLDQAAAGAAAMIADPQFQSDIKGTASNTRVATSELTETIKAARAATADVQKVFKKVGEMIGVDAPAKPKPRPPTAPAAGLGTRLDFLYDGGKGQTRLDGNYTFQLGADTFYRLGLYDIGESVKINAQVGKPLSDKSSIRAGYYQSRVGLGYDWQVDKNFTLQGDLYRPNQLRLDLKGRFPLGPDISGVAGFEDIGGKSNPVAGLQFKF